MQKAKNARDPSSYILYSYVDGREAWYKTKAPFLGGALKFGWLPEFIPRAFWHAKNSEQADIIPAHHCMGEQP